jgi:drug/metabolite transporter (DMT)-like permease
MALGFVGVGLLNFESNLRANPIGAVSLTIATITWALGSIWSQRLSLPKGMMASAAQMLVGSVVLFALSLITGERLTGTPTIRSVGAIAYLVAFGSLIGFSSYAYLLRRVRPALATSYAYVNPIVAVGLGVALAGEHISGVGLLAMMVVLCGVGLVVLKRR